VCVCVCVSSEISWKEWQPNIY